jgi:hypothetical protein
MSVGLPVDLCWYEYGYEPASSRGVGAAHIPQLPCQPTDGQNWMIACGVVQFASASACGGEKLVVETGDTTVIWFGGAPRYSAQA